MKPSLSNTIRQKLLCGGTSEKWRKHGSWVPLSGLLVAECFWVGGGEWPCPSTSEQRSSRTLCLKQRALHEAVSSEMLLLVHKSRGWILSAWSQPPCTALTDSFVKSCCLFFSHMGEVCSSCALLGLKPPSSSTIFFLFLIKQWNICRWKVVPLSA